MLTQMTRHWWVLVLRGLIALVFGILVIVTPLITLQALILFLSAYLLVDGLSNIFAAFQNRGHNTQWWVTLIEGVVSVIAGILAFIWPGVTALTVLYIIAAWAIVTGIVEIIAAIELRKAIHNEFFLALSGVLSILFGVFLILFPGTGILTLLWLLAAYSIIFGAVLLILGFRMRSAGSTPIGHAV